MHKMDLTDWILATTFVAVVSAAFGLAFSPYGYLIGATLGGYLIYNAKKRRDQLNSGPKADDLSAGKSPADEPTHPPSEPDR